MSHPGDTHTPPFQRALAALRRLQGPAAQGERERGARRVIHELDGAWAADAQALSALAQVLDAHLQCFLEHVEARPELAGPRDEVLGLDAEGLTYLVQRGGAGEAAAATLREAAEARWEETLSLPDQDLSRWSWWLDEQSELPPFVDALLRVLWLDVVLPQLLAFRRRMPVISLAVLDASRGAFWAPGRRLADTTFGRSVLDVRGHAVAHVRPTRLAPVVPEALARTLTASRSLPAHRLFRFLIAEGVRQEADRSLRDFRKLIVPGGFSGLTRALGLGGKKAAGELHAALDVFQHLHLDLPHGAIGGLLTWELRAEAPRRPAELHIILSDALLPGFVVGVRKGTRTGQWARRLVPIPSELPPLFGHRRHHAAQAALQLLVLAEFREAAGELLHHGQVHIPSARWRQLAEEAALPERLLGPVLRHWSAGDTRAGPFLLAAPAAPEAFQLAEAYRREQEFIEASGRAEHRGRIAQAASQRAKRRRGWSAGW